MIKRSILLLLALLFFPGVSFGDWQSTLESNFDIVDTFDTTQPWTGGNQNGYFYVNDYPNDMPLLDDGSPSMWGAYSEYYVGTSAHEDWIGAHANGVWSGDQSMCINYAPLYCDANADDVKGYGPDRMLAYFGTGTAASGYNDIYVFHMIKLPRGFFGEESADVVQWGATVKFFSLQRGFKDVKWFTNPADGTDTAAPYGLDFHIDNWGSGRGDEATRINLPVQTNFQEFDATFYYNKTSYAYNWEPLEWPQDLYFADEWFAVERRVKNNSAPGVADGEYSMWIYDKDGTIVDSQTVTGLNNRGWEDHGINRVEFGGNYQCVSGTNPLADGDKPMFFIDDLIIDDNRIGPTYFSLLGSQTQTGRTRLNGFMLNGAPVSMPE